MGTLEIFVLTFLIVLFAALYLAYLSTKKPKQDPRTFIKTKQEDWLNANKLHNLPQYSFGNNYFVMDEHNQTIYVSNPILLETSNIFAAIPFAKIIGFETYVDNQVETRTDGGISRAVVGGLLFGGAGAIVGASTAKQVSSDTVNSYKAVIYIDDLKNPRFEFPLITQKTDKQSPIYREAEGFAESVNASVKVIQSRRLSGNSAPAQRSLPGQNTQNRIEAPNKTSRKCAGCGNKPIVAAKLISNDSVYNVFLCERCLHTAGKKARIKVVGSISPDYPVGYEVNPNSETEPSLDDFEFHD